MLRSWFTLLVILANYLYTGASWYTLKNENKGSELVDIMAHLHEYVPMRKSGYPVLPFMQFLLVETNSQQLEQGVQSLRR